ncbi:hypothetical protein FLONG3_122 [Fusarium longipes]|uniref:chitin synthase n=1 Tax=Fusarium longipes TaxID=694270 RepID=A0A395TB22_9HYPO|nr:hypothetical protein FLONG3_122 [Fusarium longipes]
MDPFSIATGCAGLITTIGSLTLSINAFVRSCREARSDLDRVSRELHSLKIVLELIQEDAKDDTRPFPETIQRHVSGIVTNCSSVVIEVQTCITKYGDGKIKSKATWVLNGQGDMEKLRSSLEAHKSALELVLDVLTLSVTKDIKTNTTEIRNNTAAIKDNTAQILEEIARLQARLPTTAAAPNNYILQNFLESMATYTESTLDVNGGFSGGASSKALSFIDESEEDRPHVSNRFELPIRNMKNEDTGDVNQPHSRSTTHDEALFEQTDDYKHTRPNAQPKGSFVELQALRLDLERTPKLLNTPEKLLLTGRPESWDQRSATEVKQTSTSIPNGGKNAQEAHSDKSSSSDDISSNSPYTLREKLEEEHQSVQTQELTPELVYRLSYGIHTFIGNFVLKLPVPETILKTVARTDHEDFTHTRFTFVTCEPLEMASERYCLRPTFYTSKPVTKFILSLKVDPLDEQCSSKWGMIHDAIAYAERKLGQDTWRQVRVHLHFTNGSNDWFDLLKRIGLVRDFSIPPKPVEKKQILSEPLTEKTNEIAGRRVIGTMYEVC